MYASHISQTHNTVKSRGGEGREERGRETEVVRLLLGITDAIVVDAKDGLSLGQTG